MAATRPLLEAMLTSRLQGDHHAWNQAAAGEIGAGAGAGRVASLLAMASRHAPRGGLEPTPKEFDEARDILPEWNPERWTILEAVRVRLLLCAPAPGEAAFVDLLEECFRYADEGELCALYRALAHLPDGERFVWRAGEGCRSNMRHVFEAVACDSPYAARYFDEPAWCQLVLKAIFIEAPVWRVAGLDRRLSPELARMALDYADERRSAGRAVPPALWLCLGGHAGSRGLEALSREVNSEHASSRAAAALGLARAGAGEQLDELLGRETDPLVRAAIEGAAAGRHDQNAFAVFEGRT